MSRFNLHIRQNSMFGKGKSKYYTLFTRDISIPIKKLQLKFLKNKRTGDYATQKKGRKTSEQQQ